MPSDGIPYPIFVYAALLALDLLCQRRRHARAIPWSARRNSSARSISRASSSRWPRSVAGLSISPSRPACCLLLMVWYGVGWSLNLLAAPLACRRRRLHCARRRHLPVGAHRRLSRLPLRHPLHGPVLDVRDAGGLSGEPGAGRLGAGCSISIPWPGLIEGFRSAFLGRPVRYLGGIALSLGVAARPLPGRRRLFREGRAPLRRHHLSAADGP